MSESLFCYMSQSTSLSFLQVIVYIAKFTACACGVIIFYFLNRLAIAYGSMRYRPTLFGKFVAGIVGMIISAGLSLAGYHTSKWEGLYTDRVHCRGSYHPNVSSQSSQLRFGILTLLVQNPLFSSSGLFSMF